MELVFVSDWPKSLKQQAWCKQRTRDLVFTWSCKNIVAFTSNSFTEKEKEKPGEYIHIIDPDKPWQVHSFRTGHRAVISSMKWDISGTKLLTADVNGTCMVSATKDYLLNDWYCMGFSTIDGESIVAVSWLHTGTKVFYNVEKMDSPNLTDKFSREKYIPSTPVFGGKALEGWVYVTSTNLVGVALLKKSGVLILATECLGVRSHVAVTDIAFNSDGKIIIATSDGTSRNNLYFHSLKLNLENNQLSLSVESLPRFHMQFYSDLTLRDKFKNISHLRFVDRDMGDQVIVCATGAHGSCMENWSMRSEQVPVHSIFQSSLTFPKPLAEVKKWSCLGNYMDPSGVYCMALPRLPLKLPSHSIYNGPGMVFAVGFQDGNIKLIHRVSMKLCNSFRFDDTKMEAVPQNPTSKRQKLAIAGRPLCCMEMSSTGCSLLGIEKTGALCLLRIAPTLGLVLDSGAARALTIAQVVNLLEYCIITGLDWWDLLLNIAPGMVETVTGRLGDVVSRQSLAMQELLHNRLLSIQATLYRLMATGVGKSMDCHIKLLLTGLAAMFRSLLRPTTLSAQEKGPAEKLKTMCSQSKETDLDKVMINLDTKNYVIEPQTLQSLQQLFQWVADLTVFLLTAIPTIQANPNRPGVTLIRDSSVLAALRELLVMVRIWGLLKPACLPVFTLTSVSTDPLSLLFSLLTKVWIQSREAEAPNQMDESIVDECCLLQSQLVVPTMESLPVGDGISGKTHGKPPMSFFFDNCSDQQTHFAIYNPSMTPGLEFNTISCNDLSQQKHDLVRRISLGVAPTDDLRQCVRCSCVSLIKSTGRNLALKSWEQRWSKSCLCGGHWYRLKIPSHNSSS